MPRAPIRLAFSCLIGLFLLSGHPASSGPIDVPALVASCSEHRNTIKLNADNDVACFDGPFRDETALDRLKPLNSGGKFVIRSPGGRLLLAMRIAELLLEKKAIVIIHDYCLSACANAILVATDETYVADNAIVAWHVGAQREFRAWAERLKAADDQTTNCRHQDLSSSFYCKRGIRGDFTQRPQTSYSRQMYRAILIQGWYDKFSIFWMWHPENFGTYFKSKMTFGSVPDSEEVNARMRRLGAAARFVYDPPPDTP